MIDNPSTPKISARDILVGALLCNDSLRAARNVPALCSHDSCYCILLVVIRESGENAYECSSAKLVMQFAAPTTPQDQ
jgi:hypothetical protein